MNNVMLADLLRALMSAERRALVIPRGRLAELLERIRLIKKNDKGNEEREND